MPLSPRRELPDRLDEVAVFSWKVISPELPGIGVSCRFTELRLVVERVDVADRPETKDQEDPLRPRDGMRAAEAA